MILAVFPGPDYSCSSSFGILCLGILIALIPIFGGVLRYLVKWHRDLVTQQTTDKNWRDEVKEQLKAQENKQHWMEIMIITIMEILLSENKSRDHAVQLLEDFKKRYPNPKMNNLSVCKCYSYALIRDNRGVKLKWQPRQSK